jgi:hypothetical protein
MSKPAYVWRRLGHRPHGAMHALATVGAGHANVASCGRKPPSWSRLAQPWVDDPRARNCKRCEAVVA